MNDNYFGIWYTGSEVTTANWNLGPVSVIVDELLDWGNAHSTSDTLCPEHDTDVWNEFHNNHWKYRDGLVTCVEEGKTTFLHEQITLINQLVNHKR